MRKGREPECFTNNIVANYFSDTSTVSLTDNKPNWVSIHITDRRANSISYDFTHQKPFDLAHRVAISWAHNITVQLCCRLS